MKTLSGIDFAGWNRETGVPREGAERAMKAQAGQTLRMNMTASHIPLIHSH